MMLVEPSLYKALQFCGSKQKKLADAIGEKPDKIWYWLNSGKRIPFHNAIAIELATRGAVSRFDLALYARLKNNRLPEEALFQQQATLIISERVAIGIALEKHYGKHQGTRNDLKLRLNLDEVKGGRSDSLAANHAGFGSKDNDSYAKKVILRRIFKLVQAMDAKQVSIFNAAIIPKQPPEKQKIILHQNKKQVIATVKQRRVTSVTKYLSTRRQTSIDVRLQQAKQQHQLLLRSLLLGLSSCCNQKNLFPWKPAQLKNHLAPFIDLDFNHVLEMLVHSGFIVKLTLQSKLYGPIILPNNLKQPIFLSRRQKIRLYGAIQSCFWADPEAQQLSDQAKLLATYLLTDPHSNIPGFFRLPAGYLMKDLRWSISKVKPAFQELSDILFLTRDDALSWLVIHHFVQWNPIQNLCQAKGTEKLFDLVPAQSKVLRPLINCLLTYGKYFCTGFLDRFHTLKNEQDNSLDTLENKIAADKEKNQNQDNKKIWMSGEPDIDSLDNSFSFEKNLSQASLKPQAIEILQFLNEKTGRVYRPVNANLQLIIARLKSGATRRDFFQIIAKKTREWKKDAKMAEYLRPATLFNAIKFEQYVGELVLSKEEKA